MDYSNFNTDYYSIVNYLHEYGVYIFICVVIGFGSLTYYLSIRTPTAVGFDSPKLTRKKTTKKEKQIRNKTIKTISTKPKEENKIEIDLKVAEKIDKSDLEKNLKVENKIDINLMVTEKIELETNKIDDAIQMDNTELMDNEAWQPVCKTSKKTPKSIENRKSTNNINTTDNQQLIENNPQPLVDVNVKEDIDQSVPLETIEEKSISDDRKSISSEIVKDEAMEKIDTTENQSEKSSSDDFEIVDAYKTSSEEGRKSQLDNINRSPDRLSLSENIGDNDNRSVQKSATSGATRKKTKKRQKLISKQLMEAAAETVEPLAIIDKPPFYPLKEDRSPVVIVAKRKSRPRKDV